MWRIVRLRQFHTHMILVWLLERNLNFNLCPRKKWECKYAIGMLEDGSIVRVVDDPNGLYLSWSQN